MFAPSYSRPPYYPSYDPPGARELEALLSTSSWLPSHGMGAANEGWKVEHGVYMNEEKESEMNSSDIQRTTHALETMKKMMAKAAKQANAEKADGRHAKAIEEKVATISDPNLLIYTDPHAYAHYMERQNVTLFTLFSFQSDQWALLKNTPFMRYLYHGMFCIDIGRLDDEGKINTAQQRRIVLIPVVMNCNVSLSHLLSLSYFLLLSSQPSRLRCSSSSVRPTCTP